MTSPLWRGAREPFPGYTGPILYLNPKAAVDSLGNKLLQCIVNFHRNVTDALQVTISQIFKYLPSLASPGEVVVAS